ncbi:MAG: hypothetical protein ACRECX_02505 [Methyloceanibacter sp.]|uniref:hypothetical protein n=1 Tax=Methyloceanibacter sp. TaxID=1965321 RepID=UPI003D6D1751
MPSRPLLPAIAAIAGLIVAADAVTGSTRSFATEQQSDIPAWLQAHVGDGEGQISQVVLQRARALYLQKVSEGAVRNVCYLAMDATRPAGLGKRFYVICEIDQTFRAVSSGHGNGRNLRGIANFSNGIRCAKNFSNAQDSKLTTGGSYVTAEIRTSFKGYYRASGNTAPLVRSFVQFEGWGDTANARPRAIGGHPAVLLRGVCLRKNPDSPYADDKGYVPFGNLVNYSAGRSNGCTSWTPSDSEEIVGLVQGVPTTLYIYPESADIDAVAQAVKAGKSPAGVGLYWNASCLREIRSPKFWPREELEPLLMKYKQDHPAPPPQPPPICKGQ